MMMRMMEVNIERRRRDSKLNRNKMRGKINNLEIMIVIIGRDD